MHKFGFKVGFVVLAIVWASGTASAADSVVVVQPGDSLSKIASRLALSTWVPIWNANPSLTDPNRIYAGQTLIIPSQPAPDRPLPAGMNVAARQASVVKVTTVAPSAGVGGIFERIRQRESGGNYAINTGNGYYGAYQFDLATWRSVGGTGLPSLASPAEQDMRAQLLYARRGCQPWPQTCY